MSLVPFDVGDGVLQDADLVIALTEQGIAVGAEQFTHGTGLVVVVDVEALRLLPAYRAAVSLLLPHGLNLSFANAVLLAVLVVSVAYLPLRVCVPLL
ncbi:hypothetical protein PV740_12455 [Streptomyces europaeiscabiei]|nr:hypothetical protein [Streptomyces europaeiscabiei]MDX3582548.1 hypothetical protein [Streptomyces europaeiscabiei]